MKLNWYYTLTLLITCNLFAQKDGEWTLSGANGKVMEHGYYENHKKNGEWNYYYDDGIPSLTVNYNKGVLNGKSVRFDLLGNKIAQLNYEKGKITGEQVYFYSGGKILSKGEMIDGKENGAWRYYSPTGDQVGIVQYKNGVQIDEQSKKK